jgi:hypothetical protein
MGTVVGRGGTSPDLIHREKKRALRTTKFYAKIFGSSRNYIEG